MAWVVLVIAGLLEVAWASILPTIGIGAVGAAVVGIMVHGDTATPARVGFLALLVVAIVGLRVTSGH